MSYSDTSSKKRFRNSQTHGHPPRYLRKFVFDNKKNHKDHTVFQRAKDDIYLIRSYRRYRFHGCHGKGIDYDSFSWVAPLQFNSSRCLLSYNWEQMANRRLSHRHTLEKKPEAVSVLTEHLFQYPQIPILPTSCSHLSLFYAESQHISIGRIWSKRHHHTPVVQHQYRTSRNDETMEEQYLASLQTRK